MRIHRPLQSSPHAREVISRVDPEVDQNDAPDDENGTGESPHHSLGDTPVAPRPDRLWRWRERHTEHAGREPDTPAEEHESDTRQDNPVEDRNDQRTHFSPPVFGSPCVKKYSYAKALENIKV